MTRSVILVISALMILGSATATIALNNEFICAQPGYSMDQRCSGN